LGNDDLRAVHKRSFEAADPEEARNRRYLRTMNRAINHFFAGELWKDTLFWCCCPCCAAGQGF